MSRARNRQRRQPAAWRRLLPLLLFAGVTAGVALPLARYLQDPATLPVRTIRIQGHFRHLDRKRLERALAAAVEGGFFGVDLEKVRRAALALPWVAQARVSRVWPDRLEVQIEEQEPVARWNDRGLVNDRGEVFYPESGSMPTLALRFEGPEEKAPQMLAFYDDLRRRLQRQGLRAVRLELDRRGEWRLKLANGVTLVVGRENPLYRLERLLGAYPVLRREGREIRRIDLRYEQGFAVAWREQKKG